MNKGIKLFSIFILLLTGLSPILENIYATSDPEIPLSEKTGGFMVPPPESTVPLEEVFNIMGDSYIDSVFPGTVVITNNSTNQLGALWTEGKIDLSNPFTYKSYIYWGRSQNAPMGSHLGQTGGDGMTITMHNDPRGYQAMGGPGGGLGAYKRPTIPTDVAISNGLSYEIDPYVNVGSGELDNGIEINSENPDLSRHMAFINPEDPIGIDKHMELSSFHSKEFQPDTWNSLTIDWTPDVSGSGEIEIKVNGFSSTLTIQDYNSYFEGDHVHLGFTGSTGGITALQAVVITEIPLFEWRLSFDLNGGSGPIPDYQYIEVGQLADSVIEPEKEGHRFIGWNTQRDGQGANWDFNSTRMPNRDLTLYAQFEEVIEGSPVFVHHEDSEGNQVAPPEEFRGIVGEIFETSPATIEGWRLLQMPEYQTGIFSLESQTITYVYERIEGQAVRVYHVDENDNEVAQHEELTGLWGDYYEAKPAIIPGMNVLAYPENVSGIFSGESQSVTFIYEVSGEIVVEFPEVIEFETTAIQTKEMLIKRTNQDLGVRITDTRIEDFQQNWVLHLSLDEELHIGEHQIPGAMVYSNGDNLVPLNEGTQEVYSKNEPVTGAININWQEDEGLLLLIPGNKALPGKYQGKVLWSLVLGP